MSSVARVMPTAWLLAAIVAMIALHFLVPGVRVIPSWWNLMGLIPLALGVAINLAADRSFHQAHTTVRPFEESTALLTTGMYRLSRNPMYLGFVLILVGVGVIMRSLTPYLVVVAFAILLDRAYVTVEERMLAARFGAGWEAYRRTTRRWL